MLPKGGGVLRGGCVLGRLCQSEGGVVSSTGVRWGGAGGGWSTSKGLGDFEGQYGVHHLFGDGVGGAGAP